MSRYRIEFTPAAFRQLRTLPVKIQLRIRTKIDSLGPDPRPAGSTKLKGVDDIYRIRIGDHRVLYQVKDKVLLVLVVNIGKRGEIYKR